MVCQHQTRIHRAHNNTLESTLHSKIFKRLSQTSLIPRPVPQSLSRQLYASHAKRCGDGQVTAPKRVTKLAANHVPAMQLCSRSCTTQLHLCQLTAAGCSLPSTPVTTHRLAVLLSFQRSSTACQRCIKPSTRTPRCCRPRPRGTGRWAAASCRRSCPPAAAWGTWGTTRP